MRACVRLRARAAQALFTLLSKWVREQERVCVRACVRLRARAAQALFTLLSKWVFCYTHHLVQELLVQTEEMQAFAEQARVPPASDIRVPSESFAGFLRLCGRAAGSRRACLRGMRVAAAAAGP